MAYDQSKPEDLITRDYLALERTHLANERTLLAYLRTALFLGVTGLTLLKFFGDNPAYVLTGYALLPLAIFVVVVGMVRFRAVRKGLARVGSQAK
jgi:putative membrane protein